MESSIATESLRPDGRIDLETVRLIHVRLLARYGTAWRAKWAGIPPEIVEKDWYHELQHTTAHALDYALEHLNPDFPPTAGQFRAVCSRAPARPPQAELPALEAPKSDRQRLVAELRRLHALLKERGPRAWIDDLQEKQARGEALSPGQLHALTEATEHPPEEAGTDAVALDRAKRVSAARVLAYAENHPGLPGAAELLR